MQDDLVLVVARLTTGPLTYSEQLVLIRLAQGRTNKQIARELNVVPGRVGTIIIDLKKRYSAVTAPHLMYKIGSSGAFTAAGQFPDMAKIIADGINNSRSDK